MSKPIFFKPEFYSGEPDECVNEFIENYNLISVANEWSDDKKIMYHYKPNNNMNNHNQSNHLTENTNQGSYSGQNNDLSNKKTFNNQKNM
ncbi:unnamed protein product [Macrosiphum euphorbiae]|uniref:Uncharacterized protein n=1 Tax=Macrosiphum euphorbiae TaxID=13131 RepID=A0AAV0VUI7_9HEMI|nr:unnamed protein product [Macrosiphum euphorbiae]